MFTDVIRCVSAERRCANIDFQCFVYKLRSTRRWRSVDVFCFSSFNNRERETGPKWEFSFSIGEFSQILLAHLNY